VKCFSVGQTLIFVPISETSSNAMWPLMPSMLVKSTPVVCSSSLRVLNKGELLPALRFGGGGTFCPLLRSSNRLIDFCELLLIEAVQKVDRLLQCEQVLLAPVALQGQRDGRLILFAAVIPQFCQFCGLRWPDRMASRIPGDDIGGSPSGVDPVPVRERIVLPKRKHAAAIHRRRQRIEIPGLDRPPDPLDDAANRTIPAGLAGTCAAPVTVDLSMARDNTCAGNRPLANGNSPARWHPAGIRRSHRRSRRIERIR